MKAVIGGFVERPDVLAKGTGLFIKYVSYTSDLNDIVKRKPATSLASLDIGLLIAWYNAVHESYGKYLTEIPYDTW